MSFIETNKKNLTQKEIDLIDYVQQREWGQTPFKAKHFVGNSQIHPYAIYRQFLMELRAREDIVRKFEYDLRTWEIDLEIKKLECQQAEGLDKKKKEFEIVKLEHDLVMHRQRIQDGYKERKQYLKLISEFEESALNTLPDGRKISENIHDEDFENEMEAEYWTLRLAKQVALDVIAYGRPTGGNLDAVTMCSNDQQNKILALAADFVVRNEARQQLLMSAAANRYNLGYRPDELSKATGVLTDINNAQQLDFDQK